VFFAPDDQLFEVADRRLTLTGHRNLAPGEDGIFEGRPGQTLVYGKSMIGPRWRLFRNTYTLQAPPTPTPAQQSRLDLPRVVARLTLTYHDAYGRIHASVSDYTDQRIWRSEALLQNIPQDLGSLDRRDRRIRTP
jgi:hypothetical protein